MKAGTKLSTNLFIWKKIVKSHQTSEAFAYFSYVLMFTFLNRQSKIKIFIGKNYIKFVYAQIVTPSHRKVNE